MRDEAFEELVESAILSLPEEFQEVMENVDIFIAPVPDRFQMQKMRKRGGGGVLLGLYEGVPQTKRGVGYGIGGHLPDRITIFKLPILRLSSNFNEAKAMVTETVLHEIGHHFGMSEDEISDAMDRLR